MVEKHMKILSDLLRVVIHFCNEYNKNCITVTTYNHQKNTAQNSSDIFRLIIQTIITAHMLFFEQEVQ